MTGAVLMLALAATATGGATVPAAPSNPIGPAADAFPRKDVPALIKSVFEKDFQFCTDPEYPLTSDELKWCALAPKQDTRCPAFTRACTHGATAQVVGERGRQPKSIALPTAPLAVRLLLWIVLGFVAALIIYTIAKQALAQRAPRKEEAVEIATAVGEDPAAAIARQVETDVQRLLDRARTAAAAGDFAAAITDAYAALLRKLEGSGIITVESHRTNGDHVRDVGRQLPALRPRMQAVVGNVEEMQFGGGAPTEPRFRSVMLDVVGLLGERLAAFLPFVVNLGLGLGLCTLVAGCSIDRDGGWDHSPSGRAGVFDLLQRYGFTPRERLASLAKIDKSVSALVLLPGASVDDATWEAIGTWTGEGGALIVAGGQRKLPSWIGAQPEADPASPAKATSPVPLTVAPHQADRLPKLTAIVPGGRMVKLTAPAPKSDADEDDAAPATPLLVRAKTPYAVERTYEGGGRAIVLADDRLLTNASLLVGDNARLLIELLRPAGQKLELAGELTGLVSHNPITSVQRGRLAPAMLQLSLLILLFFVYKGAHFGRPVDPATASRRAFSEHARAIGMLYGRTRAGRHALEAYGGYALERMRERLNLVGGKGMLAVAEEVAARTGRPLGEVMRVLVESRPATRPADALRDPVREMAMQEATSAKDLETLRDLATLLANTGGAGERIRAQRKA